jgi:hypothetical protein
LASLVAAIATKIRQRQTAMAFLSSSGLRAVNDMKRKSRFRRLSVDSSKSCPKASSEIAHSTASPLTLNSLNVASLYRCPTQTARISKRLRPLGYRMRSCLVPAPSDQLNLRHQEEQTALLVARVHLTKLRSPIDSQESRRGAVGLIMS